MFITALFTTSKTWKQHMSIDRRKDKEDVVYEYNGTLLSHKKEWNNAICSCMHGPRNYHTKWSQSDRERQIYNITCGLVKKGHKLTYSQNRNGLTENKLMPTNGDSCGRRTDKLEFRIKIYTLLYINR